MANLSQDTVIPVPVDEVPSWVMNDQIGVYFNVVLATIVTYDAGESLP